MSKDAKLTYRQTARHRQSIRVGELITRLHKVVTGEVEMNTAQIKAATVLLGKAMPDLQSVDSTVETREAPKDEAQLKAELAELLKNLKPEELAQLQAMQTDKEGESAADLH